MLRLNKIFSKQSLTDYFFQESEIYAAEYKYSYALYHAERGLALAARKDDKDMVQDFRVQVGKYSQHSTSEKVCKIC